jgi:hypothetical protein
MVLSVVKAENHVAVLLIKKSVPEAMNAKKNVAMLVIKKLVISLVVKERKHQPNQPEVRIL